MKIGTIKTNADILDILDMCDSEGTPIYIKYNNINVPVDNFELFKLVAALHTNDVHRPCVNIIESDDELFLEEVALDEEIGN